ncbi:MAG: HNH endonuclease, partial [Acidimicrobiia bacterium]|nr:HNH endonuclease [Acidimicrobiia bacterium]
TDPDTNQPVGVGVTRRRPTAQQKRVIRAHSPHCVMTGCRVSSVHSDLDHTIDWANGGPTETSNMDPTCRHDHRIKHQAGWSYQKLPNGHHQWTSRLGHTYTNKPEPP